MEVKSLPGTKLSGLVNSNEAFFFVNNMFFHVSEYVGHHGKLSHFLANFTMTL